MPMPKFTFAAAFLAGATLLAGPNAVLAEANPKSLVAKFDQTDQTIEYHVMIAVPVFKEADLAKIWETEIVKRLAPVAKVEALKKPKPGIYVDSKDHGLEKQNLIVRVRQGQITLKARAASADTLLDLAPCSTKKYEMDYFGTPDYSISSDISFKPEEFDTAPKAWNPPKLWDFIASKCPAIAAQIAPVIKAAPGLDIPGVVTMYGAEAQLAHPDATALVKDGLEAGVSVWFFHPTDKMLVELSFTGSVKHKATGEKIWNDIRAKLKAAGMLAADQSSKTQQYFVAYTGTK